MPASKRRRAATNASRATRPAAAEIVDAEPLPAAVPAATEPTTHQDRRPRPASTNPDDEPQWSRMGLLVLLGLVCVVQVVIGAITHVISGRQRLLVVDLLFFQAPFVLPACVVLMPLARYLTKQPRTLRLLESLSLGAVFALVSLLLTSVFVHPAATAAASSEQLIDKLTSGDAAGIAFADLLSVVGTVQVYPGLNRFLGAPGRRARKRMIERSQGGTARRSGRPAPKPRAARPAPKRPRP